MKKTELSLMSSEGEEDAGLSLESSLLTSDPDQDCGINFLLDEDMAADQMGIDLSLVPRMPSMIPGFNFSMADFGGSPLPKELELRPGMLPGEVSVWSGIELCKGTLFGPILAQLRDSAPPVPSVWKIVDDRGCVKAWVDTSVSRSGQWTAFLRKTNDPTSSNVQPVFNGGQIFLEVVKDIEASQELKFSTCEIVLPGESDHNGIQEPSSLTSESGNSGDFQKRDLSSSYSLISPNSPTSSENQSPSPNSKSQPLPPPLVPIQDDAPKCLSCDQFRAADHLVPGHFSEDSSGTGEREYKCSQCSKVFNWKSNLIRHQVAHDESRRYVCENCKKVFTDPSNLQRHIRSQHIGARSHACPECGKTFATSSGLKQHTHIHSSVKPFRCEVCFKAYTQFSNLCRHKRMHATCRMQIKCHKCGQAFSAVTSLSKHKRFCEGTVTPGGQILNSLPSNFPGSSASTPTYDQDKAVSMSIAPPGNPLIFYPRPGFPFYPPSLFGYPLFSGTALPAPPPLIHDANLLLGPTSSVQDIQGENYNQDSPNTSKTNSRADKQNSEGSETEASEEVSSDSGGEDVSSFSDAESEGDTVLSMDSSPKHSKEINMFTNQRQSSPKQGSVCPEQASVAPVMPSSGLLRPLMAKCSTSKEMDMPFDLSRTNKMAAEEDFQSKVIEGSKSDEQPLDLRIAQKKIPTPSESPHKTHVFGGEKPKEVEKEKPPQLPQPPPPQEIPEPDVKQENPTPSSTSKMLMAYPRPIHPMFLESMYRMQQEKPAFNLFGSPERLMAPFPPRYPFLSPILGSNPPFDFMRAHMEKVGKPMHEMMSPHLNKVKERYSCKFCGKIFPRSANLTRHLRTHTGEQPYKCKYCERSFSISSNLQRHVRNIHNKEKPFKCPLCDRCFGQQTNLDRHLKKHESDGPTILDDSPKALDVDDKDEAYFDEIRNFIGKVTNRNSIEGGTMGCSNDNEMVDTDHMDKYSKSESIAAYRTSPKSAHSRNGEDVHIPQMDEESSIKKARLDQEALNCSPPHHKKDLTREDFASNIETILPSGRNGDTSLAQQKALAYEVMLSLNPKLDLPNGIQENGTKTVDKAQSDGDSREDNHIKETTVVE